MYCSFYYQEVYLFHGNEINFNEFSSSMDKVRDLSGWTELETAFLTQAQIWVLMQKYANIISAASIFQHMEERWYSMKSAIIECALLNS